MSHHNHAELTALLTDLGVGQGVLQLLPDEAELLPYLLKDLPGEAGLRLRARWYPRIFGALGEGCGIGPGVTFVHPERIFLGQGVRLAGNSHLEVPGANGRIAFGDQVYLGWGSYVNTWESAGYVTVGSQTWIGAGTQLWGHRGIEIGANCPIAPGLLVVPYQHEFGDTTRPIHEQGGTSAKVVIEDDVYLGMSVRLLLGVTLGQGAVVGAGAVVTRSVPPYGVAVGVPARILRDRRSGQKVE